METGLDAEARLRRKVAGFAGQEQARAALGSGPPSRRALRAASPEADEGACARAAARLLAVSLPIGG